MLGLELGADALLHRPLVEVHLPVEDGDFAEVEVLGDVTGDAGDEAVSDGSGKTRLPTSTFEIAASAGS